MASTPIEGLSSDRVQDQAGIDMEDICCPICHDILWKPVSCQACDTPFCSACIAKWLKTNPRKCPMRCDRYVEKTCSRFVGKQLAKLQITCIYQSNGCKEIVPYEALEKHEKQCDYRNEQCPGCDLPMLKQDLIEHEAQCELIRLKCTDCNLIYLRLEANELHTDILCVKKQLKDVQHQSQEKIKQLEGDLDQHKRQLKKLNEDCTEHSRKLNAMRKFMFDVPIKIIFDDIPDASMTYGTVPSNYKKLRWTSFSYMYEQYAKVNYPDKGYANAFTVNDSQYIAWSSSSASISAERDKEVFDVVSFEACAVYNNNVKLTITGHRNFTQVHTHTQTLSFGKLELIELCWANIDTLKFEPVEVATHVKTGSGPHFLLGSLTITGSR